MTFDSEEELYKYLLEENFKFDGDIYTIVEDKLILNGKFVEFLNSFSKSKTKQDKVSEWYENIKPHIPFRVNGYTVKALDNESKKIIKKLLDEYTDEEVEKLNKGIIEYYKQGGYVVKLSNFFIQELYKNVDDILRDNQDGRYK